MRRSATCTRCAGSTGPRSPPTRPRRPWSTAIGSATIEHKLGRVHDRRGDHELAERHLAEALRLGGESARVQADRSLAAHRRGRGDQAVELAHRALELGEADADTEAVAQAENILGMLTRDPAHLERSVALAETLPDRSVLVAALNNLALACERAHDRDRAIELTERALELCSEQGDRHREAALNNNLADLLHRAGREDDSMDPPQAGGHDLRRDRRRRGRHAARGVEAGRVVRCAPRCRSDPECLVSGSALVCCCPAGVGFLDSGDSDGLIREESGYHAPTYVADVLWFFVGHRRIVASG